MKASQWVTDQKKLSLDVVLVSGAGLSLPFGGAVVLILIRTELQRGLSMFCLLVLPKGGSQHINIFIIIFGLVRSQLSLFVNLLMNLNFDLVTPKCTHLPAVDVRDSHHKNQDDDSAANKQTNRVKNRTSLREISCKSLYSDLLKELR